MPGIGQYGVGIKFRFGLLDIKEATSKCNFGIEICQQIKIHQSKCNSERAERLILNVTHQIPENKLYHFNSKNGENLSSFVIKISTIEFVGKPDLSPVAGKTWIFSTKNRSQLLPLKTRPFYFTTEN
ncbi:hypothetical protein HUJ04_008146 [Dendroctonus ponderosae]|nr:hypothetical protein HUJ04_008146 [Dendroctonus ponderosae]KAH1027125.1 hypothetical protein HUJ05_000694 [Dendroctonus ponderosae]